MDRHVFGRGEVRRCVISTEGCHPVAFSSIIKRDTLAAALGGTIGDNGLTRTCLFYNPENIKGAAYTHVFTGTVGYRRPHRSNRTYGAYRDYRTFGRRHSCGVFRLSTTDGGNISRVGALVRRAHVPPRMNGCGIFVVSRIRVLDTTTFGTFLGALRRPPSRIVFVLTAARGRGVLPAVLDEYRVCSFRQVAIPGAVTRLGVITRGRNVRCRRRTLTIVTRGTSKNVQSTLSVFSRTTDFYRNGVACRGIVRSLGILSDSGCFGLISLTLRGGIDRVVLLLSGVLNGKFSNKGVVRKLTRRMHGIVVTGSARALPLLRADRRRGTGCIRRTGGTPAPFLCGTLRLVGGYSIRCQRDSGGQLLMRLALVRVNRVARPRSRSIPDTKHAPRELGSLFRGVITRLGPTSRNTNTKRRDNDGTPVAKTRPITTTATTPVSARGGNSRRTTSTTSPGTGAVLGSPTRMGLGNVNVDFTGLRGARRGDRHVCGPVSRLGRRAPTSAKTTTGRSRPFARRRMRNR